MDAEKTDKYKAQRKYDAKNVEHVWIKLYKSRRDPSLDRIKAAAAREGVSLNTFVVEAIKDKL